MKYIPNKVNLLLLIIISILFSRCALIRGLFLESEAGLVTTRLATARSGFVLSETSTIRLTGRRQVAGGRIITTSELSQSEKILEMAHFEQSIQFLRRVKVGSFTGKGQRSLFIKEAGKNIEVARIVGISEAGETVVQFFSENQAISKPFSMPGRIYKVNSNKAKLYTGRGYQYNIYKNILETGDPVFVLEEAKNGWYYVQYQNYRGYIPAELITLVILNSNEEKIFKKNQLYIADEKGTTVLCFSNLTNQSVAILLNQLAYDELSEALPGNNSTSVYVLGPNETLSLTNIPSSFSYTYTVYDKNIRIYDNGSVDRSFLYNYIDKGHINLIPHTNQYILINPDSNILSDENNAVLDNSFYKNTLNNIPVGNIGFHNESAKPISIFLSFPFDGQYEMSGPSNFRSLEIIIPPGITKYIYNLHKGVPYHYSVFNKPLSFTRMENSLYQDGFLLSSGFRINPDNPTLITIGKKGFIDNRERSKINDSRIKIVNKTGKRIAVFLCTYEDNCGPGNIGADWAILDIDQETTFELLFNNYNYAISGYNWKLGKINSLSTVYESENLFYKLNSLTKENNPGIIELRKSN